MSDARQWHMFVDESGSFDPEEPYPLLGAIVVQADDIDAFHSEVRERIQSVAPNLRWPFHATHLNIPMFHALAAVASGAPSPEDEFVVERLRYVDKNYVADTIERIQYGTKVHQDRLHRYAQWIAACGGELEKALGQIEQRVLTTNAGIKAVAASVAAEHQMFVVSAAETFDCEGLGYPFGRYFSVCDALIERAHDCVARLGEVATLTVSALELTVDLPDARLPLTAQHLAGAVVRVADVRNGSMVRLSAGMVARFDWHVPATFVLADLVANRAGNVFRLGRARNLPEAEERLSRKLGMPVQSGDPPGTHCAASGWAREFVESRRRRLLTTSRPLYSRPWACQQAEQWAAILS